ncbi:MAG: DUF4215 domain-containing protein [Deltaproteobacteria bacterium]|nr:DUF4215 domain-containing protein [Deltaproteobacteria bacterium]
MTPRHVRALAASAAMAALAGCPSTPAGTNETVVALTVTFDDALGVDQLQVSFELDGAAAFTPATVPEVPQDLDASGELLEFVLDAGLDGQVLTLSVAGLAAGFAVAVGSTDATIAAGQRVEAAVALVAPVFEECGDGSVGDTEACDDGDLVDGDGCTGTCAVEPGFVCVGEPSQCAETCGDGDLDAGEQCDDGALEVEDGCDASCAVETGYACSGEPSTCAPTCGDGDLDANEECDDLGLVAGDGCDDRCVVEDGFTCLGTPSTCEPACGDGLLRAGEACDDGGRVDADGCSADCAQETGFACAGEPSVCAPACTIGGITIAEGALDPANPCRACRTAVSAADYSALDDATACVDDEYCDGAETCTGGVCSTSGAAPCTDPTRPLCAEIAELCVCLPASCDDGLFCTGAETCGATGTCEPATPVSCTGTRPICSESADRCVECDDDGDCVAPNPSCVANTCVACPTCQCPDGQHDGGDGVCVANGTCSSGYDRGYADLDLDGVGAGPRLDDCDPVPFPAGVSSVDTDCNDSNGSVSYVETLHPDRDGDGFTATPESVCRGASLPAGFLAAAQPPPFVSFQAGAANDLGAGASWGSTELADVAYQDTNGATCSPSSSSDSQLFTPVDFDLRVPSTATIRGIRANIRRDNDNASGGATVFDVVVRLVMTGAAIGDNRASATPWPSSAATATYGGATDLWGVALTPAMVNDPAFGFGVAVRKSAAGSIDAEIDHMWLEVFTDQGVDCNDNDNTLWASRAVFTDADNDHYTVGTELTRCVGLVVPTGTTQRGSASADCYEGNANAHPTQSTYYSSNRGDGSYDYNCDGSTSKQSVSEDTACDACVVDGITCVATGRSYTPGASCGSSTTDDYCSATCPCSLTQGSTSVRCR